MKLSECTMGALVEHRIDRRIGHVVGLEVNSQNEVIPVVQFAQPFRPFTEPDAPNEPLGIHHANLDGFTD